MSGIGLYLLDADEEPGSEVYSAATKRDQARISHGEASRMVKASPSLAKRITIHRDNLHVIQTASKFEPLGADSDTMDGLNVHGALIDELHAHKNRQVWDVLETATGARRQSLQIAITTAGFDRHSICWEQNQYVQKILEGIYENDTYWGIIYTLDKIRIRNDDKTETEEDEDYTDESLWIKANPNLGVSVKIDDVKRIVDKAKQVPSAENACKRLRMDIWTESDIKWITSSAWNACANRDLKFEDFVGESCYLAFDLANKIDISALIIVFYKNDELFVFGRYYLPEETVARSKNSQHYKQWVKDGLIIETPGAMTHYKYIEVDIEEINKKNPILELAFDPSEATYLVNNLMEWLGEDRCIEIKQGPSHISESMKQLEGLIYDKKIHHNGDPVLAWNMSNVVKKESKSGDPVKYYYPTKTSYDNKIDGAVALIMGVGRAMLHNQPEESAYKDKSYEEIMERMAL